MYFARPHRLPGQLKHQGYGLEYWAHFGGNRARFTGIGRGLAKQLAVEHGEPRQLNPELRV
jgi:hypothetical protein